METNFIGEKKVSVVVDTGRVTPMGAKMLKVCYENDTYEYMPEKRFEITKSAEARDESFVRGALLAYACKEIGSVVYGMLHEYGAKLSEVEPITNQVIALVNNATEKANNFLWAIDYADQRTLNSINDILVENVTKINNAGASNGEGTSPAVENKI